MSAQSETSKQLAELEAAFAESFPGPLRDILASDIARLREQVSRKSKSSRSVRSSKAA